MISFTTTAALGSSTADSYQSVDAMNTLAGTVVGLAAWGTATSEEKAKAATLATADIDSAMRYQGRKYDQSQARAFPRLAYDGPLPLTTYPAMTAAQAAAGEVWDWDADQDAAIVPADVLLAHLYQSDWILSGGPASLDAAHRGLVSQTTGRLSETYDTAAPAAATGLCRRAWQLLKKYRLRSGRIL